MSNIRLFTINLDAFKNDLTRIHSQLGGPEAKIELPENLSSPESAVYKYNPLLWTLNFLGKGLEVATKLLDTLANSIHSHVENMI